MSYFSRFKLSNKILPGGFGNMGWPHPGIGAGASCCGNDHVHEVALC